MQTKRQVVETSFEEVWFKENTDTIKTLFVPDGKELHTAEGLARENKLSPDDFVAFQGAVLGLVSDMKVTIDQAMESGDWIVTRCSVQAKSRNTGEPVQMIGSCWARITDGKIREAHNYFDFLHFFEGLELLPQDSFNTCLAGQGL